MLTAYMLDKSEEWDAIVRSFKAYDTYWLSGYVKAFWLHGDGDPVLFYYEDKGTRGINVVMKRDIAKVPRFAGRLPEGRYFDFSTPYGYGGWLIEGNDTEALFSAYQARVCKYGIVSEFVRFHPLVRNHIPCSPFYDVVQLGEVVHMDLASPETVFANMTSQNRNKIRKAAKNGVRVFNGRFPAIFETFRDIYNATMDKDSADRYYYVSPEFYASILDDLPHNAQIFYAQKDGTVIAAAIMLCANGRMNYHLSGSLGEYVHLAPTNLILAEAALWGCENGCKTLYLGGGVGSEEDSLFVFKRGFNRGELCRFHIGKKVFNPQKYEELVALSGQSGASYFPAYRA